ncbi:MAG: 3-isopropylmalate dehydratase small subunit, partial [Gemmatimonadales bacterium]
AVRALYGWNSGIRAIIGESFADIFFSNAIASGVPCLVADGRHLEQAMQACDSHSELRFTVLIETMALVFDARAIPLTMPEGARRQMLDGTWDMTVELLTSEAEIESKARRLEYFNNWAGPMKRKSPPVAPRDTEAIVLRVLQSVLPEASGVRSITKLSDCDLTELNIDSMQWISFVLGVEKAFNVELDDAVMVRRGKRTLHTLVKCVNRRAAH